MGLIIGLDYDPTLRAARLQITYTAMGCPAMDMIQDDIRARLLREADVDSVSIEVVWDLAVDPSAAQRARSRNDARPGRGSV